MASSNKIVPFILKWEGNLSKNIDDTAAANPVPDGSGYHTNKGVTWSAWSSVFGSTEESIKRFYKMAQEDWNAIFKPLFWDKLQLSKINSQRIADILAGWAWAAGPSTPIKAVQKIVGTTPDGIVGNKTITAINAANEQELFNALKAANIQYFQDLSSKPKYATFKKGWADRLNDFYNNYVNSVSPLIIVGVLGIIALALISK
jgi:lysozyme family protein